MLAAVLKVVIAQRLIRKVCRECNAIGCTHCFHIGYLGRTVIAEFIPVDVEFSDMIAAGTVIEKMRLYLLKRNIKTLHDDAEEKLLSGLTTELEIKRELGVRQ
jgi:type II secretory ATPase GspE/PulE/Tfp pilus assembly ATPase PilB-like protein